MGLKNLFSPSSKNPELKTTSLENEIPSAKKNDRKPNVAFPFHDAKGTTFPPPLSIEASVATEPEKVGEVSPRSKPIAARNRKNPRNEDEKKVEVKDADKRRHKSPRKIKSPVERSNLKTTDKEYSETYRKPAVKKSQPDDASICPTKLKEIINNSIKEAVKTIVKECRMVPKMQDDDDTRFKEPDKKQKKEIERSSCCKNQIPIKPKHNCCKYVMQEHCNNYPVLSKPCDNGYKQSYRPAPKNADVTTPQKKLQEVKIKNICRDARNRKFLKPGTNGKTDNRRMTGNVNIYICSEANESAQTKNNQKKKPEPCTESSSETTTGQINGTEPSSYKLMHDALKERKKLLEEDSDFLPEKEGVKYNGINSHACAKCEEVDIGNNESSSSTEIECICTNPRMGAADRRSVRDKDADDIWLPDSVCTNAYQVKRKNKNAWRTCDDTDHYWQSKSACKNNCVRCYKNKCKRDDCSLNSDGTVDAKTVDSSNSDDYISKTICTNFQRGDVNDSECKCRCDENREPGGSFNDCKFRGRFKKMNRCARKAELAHDWSACNCITEEEEEDYCTNKIGIDKKYPQEFVTRPRSETVVEEICLCPEFHKFHKKDDHFERQRDAADKIIRDKIDKREELSGKKKLKELGKGEEGNGTRKWGQQPLLDATSPKPRKIDPRLLKNISKARGKVEISQKGTQNKNVQPAVSISDSARSVPSNQLHSKRVQLAKPIKSTKDADYPKRSKSVEKSPEKSPEKTPEKSQEKSPEGSQEKSPEGSQEKSPEKSPGNSHEKSQEKSAGKPKEKSSLGKEKEIRSKDMAKEKKPKSKEIIKDKDAKPKETVKEKEVKSEDADKKQEDDKKEEKVIQEKKKDLVLLQALKKVVNFVTCRKNKPKDNKTTENVESDREADKKMQDDKTENTKNKSASQTINVKSKEKNEEGKKNVDANKKPEVNKEKNVKKPPNLVGDSRKKNIKEGEDKKIIKRPAIPIPGTSRNTPKIVKDEKENEKEKTIPKSMKERVPKLKLLEAMANKKAQSPTRGAKLQKPVEKSEPIKDVKKDDKLDREKKSEDVKPEKKSEAQKPTISKVATPKILSPKISGNTESEKQAIVSSEKEQKIPELPKMQKQEPQKQSPDSKTCRCENIQEKDFHACTNYGYPKCPNIDENINYAEHNEQSCTCRCMQMHSRYEQPTNFPKNSVKEEKNFRKHEPLIFVERCRNWKECNCRKPINCNNCRKPRNECCCTGHRKRKEEHRHRKSVFCLFCDKPRDGCVCRSPVRQCSCCQLATDLCRCKDREIFGKRDGRSVHGDPDNDRTMYVTGWKPRHEVRHYFARDLQDLRADSKEDCCCYEKLRPHGSDDLPYQRLSVFSHVMNELQQKISESTCCASCRKVPCCCNLKVSRDDRNEDREITYCVSPRSRHKSSSRSAERSRSRSPTICKRDASPPTNNHQRTMAINRVCCSCKATPCRCQKSKSSHRKPKAKCYYCKSSPCICITVREHGKPRPCRCADSPCYTKEIAFVPCEKLSANPNNDEEFVCVY